MATIQHRSRGPDGELLARGQLLGVEWRAIREGDHIELRIAGRPIHVKQDELGTFVSHAVFGRRRSIRAIAEALIRFHPYFSPQARRDLPRV